MLFSIAPFVFGAYVVFIAGALKELVFVTDLRFPKGVPLFLDILFWD